MADKQHVTLLRRSVREWNRWRAENPQVTPDLAGAGLRGLDLSGANLAGALLKGADLRGTILSGSSLAGSGLAEANLFKAVLDSADLDSADLRGVRFLDCAQLSRARNWQRAYRDADLECGVPIPQRHGSTRRAGVGATGSSTSPRPVHVLIYIVTRCVSSGAMKSPDSTVPSRLICSAPCPT